MKTDFHSFLGLEVFYQVAGQIILFIYAKTGSRAAGGLETVKDTLMGLQIDPDLVLGISNALTLKSCFTLHMKAIKTAKLYLPWRSSVLILLWGLFSSLGESFLWFVGSYPAWASSVSCIIIKYNS